MSTSTQVNKLPATALRIWWSIIDAGNQPEQSGFGVFAGIQRLDLAPHDVPQDFWAFVELVLGDFPEAPVLQSEYDRLRAATLEELAEEAASEHDSISHDRGQLAAKLQRAEQEFTDLISCLLGFRRAERLEGREIVTRLWLGRLDQLRTEIAECEAELSVEPPRPESAAAYRERRLDEIIDHGIHGLSGETERHWRAAHAAALALVGVLIDQFID